MGWPNDAPPPIDFSPAGLLLAAGREDEVQLLYRIGQMIDMLQQVPRTIEALGLLGLAGACHLS